MIIIIIIIIGEELQNMKVTVILVVIGVLGTITNCLVKGLEVLDIRGQVEVMKIIHHN